MSVRSDLVSVALGEVGYKESSVDKTKYGEWYGLNGTAWCCIFVCWCANQVGILGDIVAKTASCTSEKNHFNSMGKYEKSAGYGGNYTPSAGDLVFFSDKHTQSTSTHIGIVTGVSGGKVQHVSGNWSNGVGTGTNGLSDLYIIGYGVIDGSGGGSSVTPQQPENSGVKYGNLTTGTSKSTGKIASTQTITKKHSTGITASRPYATVEIYTETAKLSINQTLTISDDSLDSDILSINTNRDMGNDCPTFSITLTYRREWYEKIASNDLLIINMCRPPEKNGVVFYGLIDDVRKNEDFGDGVSRKITITGRGLSKALARFEVGTLSEVNMMASTYGFLNQATIDGIGGKPPATVIKTILSFCLGLGCDYEFSNGKKLTDYMKTYFSGSDNSADKLTDVASITSYSGSLWNLLKELKDAPFNEMFWEIINNQPTLIFRPTPFEEEDWTKLSRITIKDNDVVSADLGISDLETYVVYKVTSETFSGETEDLILPIWYKPYYKKYGLSRLDVSSLYLGVNISQVSVKTEKLFNWNILNNSMENGSIVVKGSNQYKVGTRVILESTGVEYYVEAVDHSFTFFEGWTTTLSLTRGLVPNKRYSAPWGCAQQIKPEDATEIFGYSIQDTELTSSEKASTNYSETSPQETSANQSLTSDEKKIWDYLMNEIGNAYGVAGIMGNLYAESGLKSNNLENSYNTSFKVTDEQYTSQVDIGVRSEYTFVHDSAGYGIAQWTYYSRKQGLYNLKKKRKVSISNLDLQLEYLISELKTSYKSTLDTLKNAKSVYEASTCVLTQYERPKDQGSTAKNKRSSYSQTYYNRYG